jgi:ribosomal protein L37E
MVDKLKVKERIDRGDGSVAPHHLSGETTIVDPGRVDGEGKMKPHDRESQVDTSIESMELICPRCGKPALHAEFPDHYEAWTKCAACGFFMGMSNEEWHRMESSPNLSEKIRKMAIKKGLVEV